MQNNTSCSRDSRSLVRARRFAESLGSFEKIFSLENLVAGALKCKNGVSWKREVQAFHLNLLRNCLQLHDALMMGTWCPSKGRRFTIKERGKARSIVACSFRDRVVQRVFCDEFLVPVVQRVLIYDNGACMPGKGTSFALQRLERHLKTHWRWHGMNGGIILFDFSKYFESIDIERSMEQFSHLIFDERMLSILRMTLSGADRGLPLGNQTAQIAAVLYPNEIDHWVKESAGIKGYGRYMDDGYMLFGEWGEMKEFAVEFEARVNKIGLSLNPAKFRFIRIGEEFTFLKTRFRLLANGSVQKRLSAETIRRYRRHRAKLIKLESKGILDSAALSASESGWKGTLDRVR